MIYTAFCNCVRVNTRLGLSEESRDSRFWNSRLSILVLLRSDLRGRRTLSLAGTGLWAHHSLGEERQTYGYLS